MKSVGDWQERVTVLVDKIVSIADAVESKDGIAVAKLKIEARQWVVEKYLLKDTSKREDAESEPISVTINATSDVL